jgi:hypothetical protein
MFCGTEFGSGGLDDVRGHTSRELSSRLTNQADQE